MPSERHIAAQFCSDTTPGGHWMHRVVGKIVCCGCSGPTFQSVSPSSPLEALAIDGASATVSSKGCDDVDALKINPKDLLQLQ